MFTFKQLEAIYWIAETGGFAQAAAKLHTTQSAISKRVQELENMFGLPLFDRSLRSARLTEKGEEMLLVARRFLELREESLDRLGRPEVLERQLRLGVTELTAITWLPRLIARIQETFPKVDIEPIVDNSVTLRNRILEDELDLIIVPDAFAEARLTSVFLANVENIWMGKPGLLKNRKRALKISELAEHPLLIQGEKSVSGIIYGRWFQEQGFKPLHGTVCNNLLALISLTISGVGISHFPRKCLSRMIPTGALEEIKVTPPLPDTAYVAMYLTEKRSTLIPEITRLARESCDFTELFPGL